MASCTPKPLVRSRRHGSQHFSSRLSCPASKAWDGAASSTIAHAVEMHFNLPYRTSYGQSLSIVGSTDDFGGWDVETRVPMEWSDGDVWKAKVVADAAAVEYKYVIVDKDGTVSQWKPGGNFEVNIEGFSGKVHIEDTWDGVHEVSTSAAEGRQGDTATLEGSSVHTESQQVGGSNGEEVGLATESGEYDNVLKAALRQTYGELQDTLDTSIELAEGVAPDDPRLLMNDQKLAAVHRKATSLTRAISAGAPPPAYILKEIEKTTQGDEEQEEA